MPVSAASQLALQRSGYLPDSYPYQPLGVRKRMLVDAIIRVLPAEEVDADADSASETPVETDAGL